MRHAAIATLLLTAVAIAGGQDSGPSDAPKSKLGESLVAAVDQEAAFRASFHNLIVATGSMTVDKDENLLRYQAGELAHEIAFLRAVAKLDISAEQAKKMLPAAKAARELIEKRAAYLRELCAAYKVQCDVVRNNNILVMSGCDRERIEKIIGKLEGMAGCPGYALGHLDHSVREQFFKDLAVLDSDAAAVLTPAQKDKLKEAQAELAWVEVPCHVRRGIWSIVVDKPTAVPVGTMGQLFLAPNAVAWLEKTAGEDQAASVKRAKDFAVLGAQAQQGYRDMINYSLRIVDGANVYSGMNFTEKQLTALIDLLNGDVKKIHAAHAAANSKSLRTLIALLEDMRSDVAAGKALSAEKMRKVVEVQKEICRGNYVGPALGQPDGYMFNSVFCLVHKDYTDAMMAVFKRLDGDVVDSSQGKLIYETNQCNWFPPRGYRDPVRVGQAAQPIVYPQHAVIAALREAKADEYPKLRDGFTAQVVGGTLSGKNVTAEVRAEETRRVTDKLDAIRAMPEARYELNKFTLLSELIRKPCPEMTGGTGAAHANKGDAKDLDWGIRYYEAQYDWSAWDFMKAMEKAGKPMPPFYEHPVSMGWSEWYFALQEMPAKFLMDPDAVPGLETLRVIARNPDPPPKIDLDSLPGAETVEDGNVVKAAPAVRKP